MVQSTCATVAFSLTDLTFQQPRLSRKPCDGHVTLDLALSIIGSFMRKAEYNEGTQSRKVATVAPYQWASKGCAVIAGG